MYHLHATLTEDLLGLRIDVDAYRTSGRRHVRLARETWVLSLPAGVDDVEREKVELLLRQYVSDLSTKLRRVFPGASVENG